MKRHLSAVIATASLVVLAGCGSITGVMDAEPIEATHHGTWRATVGARTLTLTFLEHRYIHHLVTNGGAPYIESGGWTATNTYIEKMWEDRDDGSLRTATKEYVWADGGNELRMTLFANENLTLFGNEEEYEAYQTEPLTWTRVAEPVVDLIGTWKSETLRADDLYSTLLLEMRADGTFMYRSGLAESSGGTVDVRVERTGSYAINEDHMSIDFMIGDATMRMDYAPTDRTDKLASTIMYDVENGPLSQWGSYINWNWVKQAD